MFNILSDVAKTWMKIVELGDFEIVLETEELAQVPFEFIHGEDWVFDSLSVLQFELLHQNINEGIWKFFVFWQNFHCGPICFYYHFRSTK